MKKQWYAISVLLVCLLITIVNAREEKVLTIEHEEGTWRTNIKYYVYTVDDGTLRVEVRVGGELSQLIGSDITRYNLESDSQVRFTVNVLLAKSWNELRLGISSGLSEGQAVLFTTVDGKSHRFTYADVQQRAWILPEALREAGLLAVEESGAVSTGGSRTAAPVARSPGAAGDVGSAPAASGENIRLLTFNIRFGCGNERECTDLNTNVENIATIISDLDPDIVALQETQGNGRSPLPLLKPRIPNYQFYEVGNQALLLKKSHSLSIGPVRLDYAQGSRYYLRSEVILNDILFVIFQTHLTRSPFRDVSSPCHSQLQEKDDSVTLSQAAELVNAISIEEKAKPIILLGDLNVEANKINNIAEILNDAAGDVGTTFPTQQYCDSRNQYGLFDQQEKIDYIFVSSNVRVGQAGRYESLPEVSDHYPVYSEVQFTGTYTPTTVVTRPERSGTPLPSPTDTTPTAPPSPVTQRNCIACQQIDQVWEMIRNALGINPQPGIAKPVWDPEQGWVSYESVYAPAPPPVSAPSVPLGISPVSPSDYDNLFIKYGQQYNIPSALLKAISAYESGGMNPNAIGPSGEVGLFQLTYSTAQSLGITTLTACCTRVTGESYLCEEERSQKTYLCHATNDRRFDPVTNIEAGARLVAGNYNTLIGSYSFASDDERIKATIAAHNIGVGRVKEYIQKLTSSGITWNDIASQLPPGDCLPGKLCQNRMNNYVNTIYNNYVQYKTQIPVG